MTRPLAFLLACLGIATFVASAAAQTASPPEDGPAEESGSDVTPPPTEPAEPAEPTKPTKPAEPAEPAEKVEVAPPQPAPDAAETPAESAATAAGQEPTGSSGAPKPAWAYLDAETSTHPGVQDATAEELAALGEDLDGAAPYPRINLHGFVDFSLRVPIVAKDNAWNFIFSDKNTFQVGNINVYVDSELSEELRSLVEVRFTYLPHGRNRSSLEDQGQPYFDSSSNDYVEAERPIKLGAIEMERAFLEYAPVPWLGIKLGQWLTPYGIWNVDHGTPTTVAASRPYLVGEELLPERQTGVQLFGAVGFGAQRLGYHLTLSNGRGPLDAYHDMDQNKGVGARLFLELQGGFGDVTVGCAGYVGRYTDAQQNVLPDANLDLQVNEEIVMQYDEQAASGDLRWEKGEYIMYAELALNVRRYTERGRPFTQSFAVLYEPRAATALQPDDRRFGFYVLQGYRLPWAGIMPYVSFDRYYRGEASMPRVWALSAGLNIRAHESVAIKLQYGRAYFDGADKRSPGRDPISATMGQVAWAF